MAGNCCGHVPFLGYYVEVNTRPYYFVARLFFRSNLFQDLCCLVEHSQLKIPTGSEDMPLPIGFQGIGASELLEERKRYFVATQVISKKAPTVTASIKSEPKC